MHPYVTAYLAAQRHNELAAGVRRARLSRLVDPRHGRVRSVWATWRDAWDAVTVPAPGPRVENYPLRRPS